jgi:hypothetical protein
VKWSHKTVIVELGASKDVSVFYCLIKGMMSEQPSIIDEKSQDSSTFCQCAMGHTSMT